MPNQRDVAKDAGVSSATVSRYLNNPGSIRPKTAEKVKIAIDKLSYRIDHSAQSLKTGKYYRVGIIAASIGAFYMEILRHIEDYLSKYGYFINISFSRYQTATDRKTVDLIKNKQADGFIIFPRLTDEDDEIIDYLINYDEKFVIMDRFLKNKNIFQVSVDNYKAGRKAARVLLDMGHKEFLFIWGHLDIASSHERFNGFNDELKDSGLVLTPDRQINGEFSAEYTYLNVKKNFPDYPKFTAVFASNDLSALGFIKASPVYGKNAGADYSIIGFDDEIYSHYMNPSLSTFQQPLHEMGIKAAELLINLMDDKIINERIYSYEADFIKRDSSNFVIKK
jgi:DNA-binding LacI/PurR family transcriptional regulator